MSQLAKEQLRVALINSHYQLVHEETLAIGSTEYLHIQARDIFQPAVERRVTAIILVHNHPSGDSTPSQSDSDFTEHMVAAGKLLGIELLDHVIIGADSYTSCLQVEVPEKS
jgi:DNA repair protein RadC